MRELGFKVGDKVIKLDCNGSLVKPGSTGIVTEIKSKGIFLGGWWVSIRWYSGVYEPWSNCITYNSDKIDHKIRKVNGLEMAIEKNKNE